MTAERTLLASRRVVLGGEDGLRIEPACVELDGSRVAAVHGLHGDAEQRLDELARERDATLLDYGDMLLSPAFINAHTHLALGFLRGADLREASRGNMVESFFFRVESKLAPEDVRAFTRMGAYESLLAGVGLVWDHYYAADQVAAGLADVGLAGVVAPTLQDRSGPGAAAWQAQLDASERIDDDAELADRGVVAALGPHATDTVSAELFARALEVAEARQLPLHLHLAQSPEEHRRAIEGYELSPVAWLERIGVLERAPSLALAHGIYVSDDDLGRLRDPRHHLVFCPFSQLVFGFPAPAARWTRLGLRWVVATDCASNNDSMSVQKELRYLAGLRSGGATHSNAYRRFVERGAPADVDAAWRVRSDDFGALASLGEPQTLLSKVWSLPGSMHPRLRAGVIAPGALANLVVWDLDHPALWPALDPLMALAMSDPVGAMHALWVAGRRIGNDGDVAGSLLRSAELAEARKEARDRLQRVLDRI